MTVQDGICTTVQDGICTTRDIRLPYYLLGRRKPWVDEYVLKRKFSALMPAFDLRPGRTNVNQVYIL
jgi:hypothetical protein